MTWPSSSIADAVQGLVNRPRSVLCLDTCDFLDIVRGFTEEGSAHARAARSVVGELKSDPERCQVVITDLVVQEWSQNVERIRRKGYEFLRETDKRIQRIGDALRDAAVVPPQPVASYADLPLVDGLVAIAEDLMRRSVVLRQDDVCVGRALARVLSQQRPSQHGMVKDSIHLEHYLALSRALGRSQFPEARLFVSANRSDFWEGPPHVHPDLREDFKEAGLQFFGKLDAALGFLGI